MLTGNPDSESGKTLAEACQKTEWQVHAYCLMPQDPEQLQSLRRGWCLGSPEFRQRMLERLGQRPGEHPRAEIRRESGVAKAERIVAEELARLGWQEADLERRRKNDPGKLALAVRLRKETVLSTKSIAARVHLGRYHTAATNLRSWMQETKTTAKEKRK